MEFLKITRTKSVIGQPKTVKEIVLNGLGLRKIGSIKKHKDNNCIRGMINKVSYLVKYEQVK